MKIRYFEKNNAIWLDFNDAQGKRKRVPSGHATEAAARKATPGLLAKHLRGEALSAVPAPATVSGNTVTIAEAFVRAGREREGWITSKDKATLQTTFDNLGLPADLPVAQLTRDYVRELRTKWLAEPGKRKGTTLSASTINHRLSMLSALLEIEDLPPHNVKHLSTKGNNRERRITDTEISTAQTWLCANAHLSCALDLCELITVALATGARQDEWLSRPWSDIAETTVVFRNTKNGTSRTVPLTPATKAILAARRGLPRGPFTALTADRITALWAQMREAMGLAADEEFVFHGLRHEALSRMSDRNTNAFTMQAIAGHASVVTTQRYVKASVAAMAAALNCNDPYISTDGV